MGSQDGQPQLLTNKKLTTVDCVAQSLAVGPIFSGGFLGAVVGLVLSPGAGLFVMVVTVVGILGIGICVAELAKRYSGAGTVYEAIAHTLGKPTGVYAAGLYHFATTVLTAGLPLMGGVLLRPFCNAHLGFNPPWWVCALFLAIVTMGINALGINVSVKSQLTILVASTIPFIILFLAVVFDGGNSLKSLSPGNVADGGSAFKGILFAILMFVGFEWSAALGEETANPKHSIPRAVIASVLICGAFYLITQYTIAVGGNDFAPLATEKVGSWLAVLIELAIILDLIAVGVGIAASASRGWYTLARDGLLPATLKKVDKRDNPINAMAMIFGAMIVVIVIGLLKYKTDQVTGEGATGGAFDIAAVQTFLTISVIGGMLICVTYALLCLGALKTFSTSPKVIVAGLVGLVAAVGGIVAQFVEGTAPVGDALWGRHIGLIAIAVVAGWLAYNVSARRDRVDAAASHAIQH